MSNPIARLWRDSSRKSKIAASVATLVLIPTIAWAAMYLVNLGVNGSVKNAGVQFTYQSATVTTPNNGDACASATLSTDKLSFTVAPGTGAFPGDKCTMNLVLSAPASNTTTGELDSLVSPNLPHGWTADIASSAGCGTQIAPGGTLNATLVLTDVSAPTDGSSVDLTGTQIGVSPQSQAPASPVCHVAN